MTPVVDQESHSSLRWLRVLYGCALSLIAILTISGQLVVQQAITRLQDDASIVNIAGRQRMLSQRLPLLMQYLAKEDNPSQQNLLRTTIRQDSSIWKDSHQKMREVASGPFRSSNAIAQFDDIQPSFQFLIQQIEHILESNGEPQDSASIQRASDAFLLGMDRIVRIFEEEARARIRRLQTLERGFLFATLITLLAEGFLIFAPLFQRLRSSIEKTERYAIEMERAKKSADHANLAKSEFLAMVNHELRNPLHALVGFLDLLRLQSLPSPSSHYVEQAVQSSQALVRLINDLLEVSALELGKPFQLDPRPTRLPTVTRELQAWASALAHQKGLQLICSTPSADVTICIDAVRFQQIAYNLLQNALRYTSRGSIQLSISLDPPPPSKAPMRLKLSVQDTGAGIAKEDLSRIFETFERCQTSQSSEAGPAMGLGLSIASKIVEAMKGTIHVESELGRGSLFRVELPLQPCDDHPWMQGPDVGLQPMYPPSPLGTALILDDHEVNRHLLAQYVQKIHWQSIPVATFDEARTLWSTRKIDLLLIDYHLADSNSLDSLIAQSDLPDVPIFFVTADITATSRIHKSLPQATILSKPLTYASFVEAIASLTSNAQASLNTTDDDFTDLRKELVRLFASEFSKGLAELQSAAAQNDRQRIGFLAHRWRGSAANAGLGDIADALLRLESERESLTSEAITERLNQLERIVHVDLNSKC